MEHVLARMVAVVPGAANGARAGITRRPGEVHELDAARIDEQLAEAGTQKYLSAPINGSRPARSSSTRWSR